MRMAVMLKFLCRIRTRMGTFSRSSLFYFGIKVARVITAVDSRIVIVSIVVNYYYYYYYYYY